MGIAHSSPNRKLCNRLIGGDETAETLRIHPAVAVGNRLQGDVVYAGKPPGRAVFEAGQSLWRILSAGASSPPEPVPL